MRCRAQDAAARRNLHNSPGFSIEGSCQPDRGGGAARALGVRSGPSDKERYASVRPWDSPVPQADTWRVVAGGDRTRFASQDHQTDRRARSGAPRGSSAACRSRPAFTGPHSPRPEHGRTRRRARRRWRDSRCDASPGSYTRCRRRWESHGSPPLADPPPRADGLTRLHLMIAAADFSGRSSCAQAFYCSVAWWLSRPPRPTPLTGASLKRPLLRSAGRPTDPWNGRPCTPTRPGLRSWVAADRQGSMIRRLHV